MCAAISLDAVFLAYQIDYPNLPGIGILEISFTILFMLELGVRLCWTRVQQTLGASVFDAILVLVGSIAWTLEHPLNVQNVPGIVMLRLLRLFRLLRFARILNFKLFRDLFLMVTGLANGFRTLLWAYMLVALVVFMISCIVRQLLAIVCMEARSKSSIARCAMKTVILHQCQQACSRAFAVYLVIVPTRMEHR